MLVKFRRFVGVTLPLLLSVAFLTLAMNTMSAKSKFSAYVMGYLSSTDGQNCHSELYLAVSTDGLKWSPLNNSMPVVIPTMGSGTMCNPRLYRLQSDTFLIVAADGKNSEYIHVWRSADLRIFQESLLRLNKDGMHVYSPDILFDKLRGLYAIIWTGKIERNRIFISYTSDFSEVTSPIVFFDPGYAVSDACVIPNEKGMNYMYYKKEEENQIYGTSSLSLAPGSFYSQSYTRGYSPFAMNEGVCSSPLVIKTNNSKVWWLWMDCNSSRMSGINVYQSNDISSDGWQSVEKTRLTLPLNSRYPTVLSITAGEYKRLSDEHQE
jgi:hypothetical protein